MSAPAQLASSGWEKFPVGMERLGFRRALFWGEGLSDAQPRESVSRRPSWCGVCGRRWEKFAWRDWWQVGLLLEGIGSGWLWVRRCVLWT